MEDLIHRTLSVSQITPFCQHKFLEIKTQSIYLNLWTTNLWKWTNPLCPRRWIPNTAKLAAASNAKGSNRNKERLTAWLQINLEGTFTRKIPWLWMGQYTTRTAGRKISRGEPNARSQHWQTSVLPEDLLQQRRPRTTSPSRTRMPIKIKPGGTFLQPKKK